MTDNAEEPVQTQQQDSAQETQTQGEAVDTERLMEEKARAIAARHFAKADGSSGEETEHTRADTRQHAVTTKIEDGNDKKESLDPPEYWSEETKRLFSSLGDEVKAKFLQGMKSATADYTRKTMELAEHGKAIKGLSGVVGKYKPYLEERGIAPESALEYLISAERALYTGTPDQKRAMLLKLAQDYGVDLPQTHPHQDKGDDIFESPRVLELEKEIKSLKAELEQEKAEQYTQVQRQAIAELKKFASEIGEDGTLKHPHVQRLAPQMKMILQMHDDWTWQQIYDEAVWLDPELRQKEIERREKSAKAKVAAHVRHAADRAERAKKLNVGSSGAPNGHDAQLTMEERARAIAARNYRSSHAS